LTESINNGKYGVVTDANGLLYMRARYYSPELRRFVNADVVQGSIDKAITLNRYAYADGNPVSFVDPFGLAAGDGKEYNFENIGDEIQKHIKDILEKIYLIYSILTELHFEQRENLNGIHPTFDEVSADDSGWIELSPEESIYHDNGVGAPERKFVHPDGREAVFDGDTLLPITDPDYIATYNYGPYVPLEYAENLGEFIIDARDHLVMDILPYHLTFNSNTREQFEEKAYASFLTLYKGAVYLYNFLFPMF